MLIEQEWLAVGHKFKDRTWNAQTEDEHSPIFVQVLSWDSAIPYSVEF